jgi:anti-sigma-K factor RskA
VTDHQVLREMAAGFVLGALDADDRRTFEQHLADCEECRRQVASFAPIPGLLGEVEGFDAEPVPAGVADRAAAQVRSEWDGLTRSRRWWRWSAVAAAVVALVLAVVAVLPDGDRGPQGTALTVEPGPVSGAVVIESRAWGTYLHLDLADLPERDRYVAWVVDDAGQWQQAATWGLSPEGKARLGGASSIQADAVASVVVTDPDRTEVLLTAVAG